MTPAQKRGALLALKFLVSVLALGAVASVVQKWDKLGHNLTQVSFGAFAIAVVAVFTSLIAGNLRWGALCRAYGATNTPPFMRLFRLYLQGFFFNTLLPGAVGGDLVRGIALRESFGEGGATSSVSVVFVERLLGLAGLLSIAATMSFIHPPAGLDAFAPFALLGLGAAITLIVLVSSASSIGPFLPAFARPFLSRIPRVHHMAPLALGFLLSLATQTCVAVGTFSLLHPLAPTFTMMDALVAIPVASAASFFPFTVGGAGAREGAFVWVLGLYHIEVERALAVSLLAWGAQIVVALIGAVLHFVPEKSHDS